MESKAARRVETVTPDDLRRYQHRGEKSQANGYASLDSTGIVPTAELPATMPPAAHATSHQHSGSDEVATAVAAANAIPKAEAGGKLAVGWIPEIPGTGVGNAPYDAISSTNVQSAINELQDEKQADLQWQDETVNQGTAGGITTVNFTGAGVAAVAAGSTLTVTASGAPTAHAATHTESGGDRLTSVALDNTGLTVRDTDASHELIVKPGSNLTANRTLALTTGDADRTLTISADTTLGGGAHSGTNTGDQTITLSGDVEGTGTTDITTLIPNDTVTFAKMVDIATDRLIGRDTAGTGDPEALTLGAGLAFTGSASIDRSALTGDVTAALGSNATTIANDAVSFAKMADLATDRLIGRDTAATGDPEALTVGGGVEFTGSGGIQRSALTGDVTASAGSGATTVANDAVTNAKLANMATQTFKGRTTAGTGDPEDMTAAQAATLLATATPTELLSTFFDDMLFGSFQNNGWTASNTGAGSATYSASDHVNSTEKAQGVIAFNPGTTATGRAAIYLNKNSILFGQGTAFTFECRLSSSALSTAGEEYNLHLGFIDNADANAEPTDGAYFVYRRNVEVDGDFWVCCTRSNSVETKTVTAVAPAAYSPLKVFKVDVNAAGTSVTFSIDGAVVATHTMDIPTGAGRQTGVGIRMFRVTYTSTQRYAYVDWCKLTLAGASAR